MNDGRPPHAHHREALVRSPFEAPGDVDGAAASLTHEGRKKEGKEKLRAFRIPIL